MVGIENKVDILELRRRTGLSQSQFAKKYHLGIRALQSWEQGIRNCPEHVVYLVGRVMALEAELDAVRNNVSWTADGFSTGIED